MGMNAFTRNKILYHPDKIHEWMTTGSTIPLLFELDLTNACDNFCPWCFGFSGLDRQDKTTWNVDNYGAKFTKEEAFDVVEQVANFGCKAMTLTGGGEPLVSKFCMDVIGHITNVGMECAVITNGNRITEEKAHIILNNCTWCRVSVDAIDAEEYLREHGVKSWDKLLDNIRTLVRVKKENNYECTIGMGYLTNGDNDGRLKGFAKLGSELGVDYTQYRPMLVGWGTENCHYKSEDTTGIIREAQDEYERDDYSVVWTEHKYEMIDANTLGRDYSVCHGESFTTVIAADKKMYVCCHMRGIEKYAIGDLTKNTVEEIWNSHQRRDALDNVDVNSFDCPPLCRHDGTNRMLHQLTVLPTHRNYI